MSSLQKFHRRTLVAGGIANLFATVGSGSDTIGYRLGYAYDSSAYLIVAPKSSEVQRAWGSYGSVRGTISTTNGVANTTTLFGFGSAAHPAAYYSRTLSTGGYNTWYLPASNELLTMHSNKSAVPFATADSFVSDYYWSSTEQNGSYAYRREFPSGALLGKPKYYVAGVEGTGYVRAVRQYYAPAAIGDGSATTGYWLGTAGDGVSKLIVAPKSTEVATNFGAYGGFPLGANSYSDGLYNTNVLAPYGATAQPAAYYCKNLTTGGYNTWYQPAREELITMASNKSATPFATNDGLAANESYWSSSEKTGSESWYVSSGSGTGGYARQDIVMKIRAVRRSTI